jgi:hypothetical protein
MSDLKTVIFLLSMAIGIGAQLQLHPDIQRTPENGKVEYFPEEVNNHLLKFLFSLSRKGRFLSLCFAPGANPTIANYNASVVNFYNATGIRARFENKNILFYF